MYEGYVCSRCCQRFKCNHARDLHMARIEGKCCHRPYCWSSPCCCSECRHVWQISKEARGWEKYINKCKHPWWRFCCCPSCCDPHGCDDCSEYSKREYMDECSRQLKASIDRISLRMEDMEKQETTKTVNKVRLVESGIKSAHKELDKLTEALDVCAKTGSSDIPSRLS